MFPKLEFQLNKNLDKEVASVFLDVEAGGVDFAQSIISYHPEINHSNIHEYIDTFYKNNKAELVESLDQIKKDWQSKENDFFKLTHKIFKGHKFPNGKYIGYLSIFDCNPRFLEDKTFQFFYKYQKDPLFVTCHEMLHFIFYDYSQKKFPELFNNMDTEDGEYWELAEIFNSIVLNTDEFHQIHGIKKMSFYPDHEVNIIKLQKVWLGNRDVNTFIEKAAEIIL